MTRAQLKEQFSRQIFFEGSSDDLWNRQRERQMEKSSNLKKIGDSRVLRY